MIKQGLTLLTVCMIVSLLFSCKQSTDASAKPKNAAPLIITIQPLGNISKALVTQIADTLRKHYKFIEVQPAIALPANAFYPAKQRYRADSLIRFLQQQTPVNKATIGITNVDISTTKGAIADWGVMGLGFCPGKACIASTYRLCNNNLATQLFKVAIHELGHTQGLKHCATKYCFMRDAEGGNTTNEETDFCTACKAILTGKGWQL